MVATCLDLFVSWWVCGRSYAGSLTNRVSCLKVATSSSVPDGCDGGAVWANRSLQSWERYRDRKGEDMIVFSGTPERSWVQVGMLTLVSFSAEFWHLYQVQIVHFNLPMFNSSWKTVTPNEELAFHSWQRPLCFCEEQTLYKLVTNIRKDSIDTRCRTIRFISNTLSEMLHFDPEPALGRGYRDSCLGCPLLEGTVAYPLTEKKTNNSRGIWSSQSQSCQSYQSD